MHLKVYYSKQWNRSDSLEIVTANLLDHQSPKEALRLWSGASKATSTNVVGKTDQPHVKKYEFKSLTHTIYKSQSKLDWRPWYQSQSINYIEVNIGRNLQDIESSGIFNYSMLLEKQTEAKNKQIGL